MPDILEHYLGTNMDNCRMQAPLHTAEVQRMQIAVGDLPVIAHTSPIWHFSLTLL